MGKLVGRYTGDMVIHKKLAHKYPELEDEEIALLYLLWRWCERLDSKDLEIAHRLIHKGSYIEEVISENTI